MHALEYTHMSTCIIFKYQSECVAERRISALNIAQRWKKNAKCATRQKCIEINDLQGNFSSDLFFNGLEKFLFQNCACMRRITNETDRQSVLKLVKSLWGKLKNRFIQIFKINIRNFRCVLLEIKYFIFSSTFQGLFVATLFCFFNGEVIAQVKRRWRNLCFSNRARANSYTATQVSVRICWLCTCFCLI